MTEEQQKFIIDKINNGWSYTKISKQLGIDRRKISNWCINNNCISSKAKNKKSISDNWTIDYYLGNKICVEINGVYWHSIDKTLEKDERKLSDLKDKGYTVINFTEYEIYNEKNKVIQIIKEHAALR